MDNLNFGEKKMIKSYAKITFMALGMVFLALFIIGVTKTVQAYRQASMNESQIEQAVNSRLFHELDSVKKEIERKQKGLHQTNNIIRKEEKTELLPVEQTWLRVKETPYWEEAKNSKGEKFINIPLISPLETADRTQMQIIRDHFKSPIDNNGLSVMSKRSEELGIDPAIPFCIAVSDSQLGTQGKGAKTKNPCNLGNNDRGDTMKFDRYVDGLVACVNQLDRPQYKNTDTIGELSNGGRILLGLQPDSGDWEKGDKVWATSTENHAINVIRCVTAVKNDYTIDHNFKFKNN
jgi:hypothetical protein